MDRDEVITRLVVGGAVTSEERQLLGGFVTRVEVANVITTLLGRYGRFPLDSEKGSGLELFVVPSGVQVVVRRYSALGTGEILPQDVAVNRYVDEEFGPMCHGVHMRRS